MISVPRPASMRMPGTIGEPGFESAFKRAHPAQSPVDQHAGDTRRAGFVRSTAVHHHVAVRPDILKHSGNIRDIHGNSAGDLPRIEPAHRG